MRPSLRAGGGSLASWRRLRSPRVLVSLLAGTLEFSSSARTIATMIGLGVSVDYALFVSSRHRQNLAEGMAVGEAAARATATAGQAVVFAGGVVVVAILGLAATGIPAAASAGYATALVVLCAVVVAVTLLQALLGFAGRRVGGVRRRRSGAAGRAGPRTSRAAPGATGSRASPCCFCSRCRRSTCAWRSPTPTPARARAQRRSAGPTTCSSPASAGASTARSPWSSSSRNRTTGRR